MNTPTGIIPAVRRMKDLEKALESRHEWIVILESRLGQLNGLVKYVKKAKKKVLLHIDLIKGLKADEYGVEYLAHEIKPDGIVTTRASVVELVKKRNILAIQRVFLLDSLSLENNIRIGNRYQPDSIELLPGKIPEVIETIREQTEIPIIASGLITTDEDIELALKAGAAAVSTSTKELWQV
ncbi:glycerol-3-phosphate responsive antiterminator GlpP [Virgibacillus indicus]|uniref:Glycerol uptake operon antiterminator regulatory protein n=1 Tax=Virgibacillus indicus TaxID=2024554 RepID=A0A265N867_9BACI|nr:glycerol-3-phosphate responsive antiterminator [Virgibacillus indicus]OZU88027.1 glycerol-3-phosphate responsive antiterminator GlpP [Virgibacillus indicus]